MPMRTIRRILVAIKDPSAHSLAAVEKATQLALASGAKLELFHSITTHVYTGLDLHADQVEELGNIRLAQYRARLEAISRIAREAGVTTSTAVEWDYPAHEAIVRRALKSKADLIVAECH